MKLSEEDKKALKRALERVRKIYKRVILVVFIAGLVRFFLGKEVLGYLSTGNYVLDPLIFSLVGSLTMGNPSTSYVISNGLMGIVSIGGIVSFLLAWVLVGLHTLPLESKTLGKGFAIARNLVGFFVSFLAGVLAYIFLRWT